MMDIDFDLTNDKIKDFLINKLQEIKCCNAKMERKLTERRNIVSSIRNTKDEPKVNVTKSFKICLSGKFVVGFEVVNTNNWSLENISIILKWNSLQPIKYQQFVFTDDAEYFLVNCPLLKPQDDSIRLEISECPYVTDTIRRSNIITSSGFLLIIIENPKFVDQLSYDLTGIVNFKQNDVMEYIELPNVQIEVGDVLGHSDGILKNNFMSLIANIICIETTTVLISMPDGHSINMDGIFEKYCSFTCLNEYNCKKYLTPNKASSLFDDSLIEVHKIKSCNMFLATLHTRNEESLNALLHHIYKSVKGIQLIPGEYYFNCILQDHQHIPSKNYLESLKQSLNDEVNYVKTNIKRNYSENFDDIRKFRRELLKIQQNSDHLNLLFANHSEVIINE